MTDILGVDLTGSYTFSKSGVPADSAAPVVIQRIIWPDLSVTAPGTTVTHLATGEYGGTLVAAVDNTAFGFIRVILYTNDPTLDNMVGWVTFEVRAVPAQQGTTVTVQSPISADLDISLEWADDYQTANGREITWLADSSWPTDTATAEFETSADYGVPFSLPFSKACTVTGLPAISITLQLTSAEVEAFKQPASAQQPSKYNYKLVAISSTGLRATVATGIMTVDKNA